MEISANDELFFERAFTMTLEPGNGKPPDENLPPMIRSGAARGEDHGSKMLKVLMGALGCASCLGLLCFGTFLSVFSVEGGVQSAVSSLLYTPTPSPVPWEINLFDDFSSNVNQWPTIQGETGTCGTENFTIQAGQINWKINSLEGCFWVRSPDLPPLTDFDVSVDVLESGSDLIDAGIVFGWGEKGDHYYFGIAAAERQFAFFRFQDRQWRQLIPWTESKRIQPLAANRLRVVGRSLQYSFFINGIKVAVQQDDEIPSGMIGLGGETRYSGDILMIQFDNFELHALPLRANARIP